DSSTASSFRVTPLAQSVPSSRRDFWRCHRNLSRISFLNHRPLGSSLWFKTCVPFLWQLLVLFILCSMTLFDLLVQEKRAACSQGYSLWF
ncbi:hypothetical protein NDU88_003096, partial [Pleurodeles waltl]